MLEKVCFCFVVFSCVIFDIIFLFFLLFLIGGNSEFDLLIDGKKNGVFLGVLGVFFGLFFCLIKLICRRVCYLFLGIRDKVIMLEESWLIIGVVMLLLVGFEVLFLKVVLMRFLLFLLDVVGRELVVLLILVFEICWVGMCLKSVLLV